MNNINQAQIVAYELGMDQRYSAARHFPCKTMQNQYMSIADLNKLDKDQDYLVNSEFLTSFFEDICSIYHGQQNESPMGTGQISSSSSSSSSSSCCCCCCCCCCCRCRCRCRCRCCCCCTCCCTCCSCTYKSGKNSSATGTTTATVLTTVLVPWLINKT